MTRAAERLVVCGTEGVQARPQGCWYDLVHDALWEVAAEEPADDGGEHRPRYRKGTWRRKLLHPMLQQSVHNRAKLLQLMLRSKSLIC